MDGVDKDIERSNIGKKREEAYEIIYNHPVKPATTRLPRLEAVNKVTPHVCDTCLFNDREIIKNGITKVDCGRLNFFLKKRKDEYCTYWKRKPD